MGVALRAAIVLHLELVETRPGGGGQRQVRLLARRRKRRQLGGWRWRVQPLYIGGCEGHDPRLGGGVLVRPLQVQVLVYGVGMKVDRGARMH